MLVQTGFLGMGYLHSKKVDINVRWSAAYLLMSMGSVLAVRYHVRNPLIQIPPRPFLRIFGSYALAYGAGHALGNSFH